MISTRLLKRITLICGPVLVGLVLVGLVAEGAWRDWVERTELAELHPDHSREVRDRNGVLLRAYTAGDGVWRLPTRVSDVDPRYLDLLISHEDKRFYDHSGVDGFAALRAVGQALWHGRPVSGASTLTMQTARLLEASGTGRIEGKLRQMRVAWALEQRLSKSEILGLYLTLAPFGGNIEGVRAASFAYFGKAAKRLTLAQSAALVALPQAPETRRPDRGAAQLLKARDRILQLAEARGVMSALDARGAISEPVPAQRRPFPALARHIADRATTGDTTGNTTLLAPLQRQLERLSIDARPTLPPKASVAIMVVDHTNGEVLASVSGFGLDGQTPAAFLDLTRTRRSPGSTLKPLVYGLAFDQGVAHPQTVIADRPVQFGSYAPQNFDGHFRGDVTLAQALQMSLNTPVVQVLDRLGPARLMALMHDTGVYAELPSGKAGLAVGLGGVGLSLEGLVQLYAMLAQHGVARNLTILPRAEQSPRRVLVERSAWQVGNILSGTPRPRNHTHTAPEVAFKTGTSYGHRDAWAVGFDGRHVVGVWIGRPDGTPMPGVFGTDLAAPLLFDAFARISPSRVPLQAPPAETLTGLTHDLPAGLQRFGARAQGLEISFPPDGAALVEGLPLTARTRHGVGPFVWLANGIPLAKTSRPEVELPVLVRGFHRLTVIDATGQSQSTSIRLVAD